MLHALLHGKLDETTPDAELREDALTSTVFGSLLWLDRWDLFAQWLLGAEPCCPDGRHSSNAHQAWFWPQMANGVEPDVVLRMGHTLVVVEAKFRANRHDKNVGEEEDERPRDQIRRQYDCVTIPAGRRSRYTEPIERAISECHIVQAFVVNGRKSRALREYEQSMRELPAGADFRLVKWQDLFRLLGDPSLVSARWAADLRAYLRRIGLDAFEGLARRLAIQSDTSPILIWHAPVVQSGFAAAIRPMSGFQPLSSVWRVAGFRDPTWGAAMGAVVGLPPLGAVWSISAHTDGERLDLRTVVARGSAKPTLLSWQLPDRPVRRTDGMR